jgi:hypothetical protein
MGSDDVADLPVGETVFGEPRMVGDPRITTAQAGVILRMSRQRVWNLIGRGDLPLDRVELWLAVLSAQKAFGVAA